MRVGASGVLLAADAVAVFFTQSVPRTKFRRWLGLAAWMSLLGPAAAQADEALRAPPLPYDLAHVRHIVAFSGPPHEGAVRAQGFVVTEEQFRQIFHPTSSARPALGRGCRAAGVNLIQTRRR